MENKINKLDNVIDFRESVMYPLVAAIFSTVAVVAGISLRIRIYLYLGTSFFFVNLFGIIAHIIISQPPENLKLAVGIVFLVTGVLFTASFLLFQMKRQEILNRYQELVKTLNAWE